MPILQLKPACKEYIWGGTILKEKYDKEFSGSTLAETWELSCHEDGPSVICGGEYDGRTLSEYIANVGNDVLGKNCARFSDFPILVKLIDAKQNLSIQVHPDDEYALREEGQYGKTEMWYVVDCIPGACIYYGFATAIDKEEFRRRIANNTLVDVLRRVPVKKGDVFFLPPGTIHALGAGVLIAEVQQNSNITYRVYDYGRVDSSGNTRELHVDRALDVTRLEPVAQTPACKGHIAISNYFLVDALHFSKETELLIDENSFAHLLVLKGHGQIYSDAQKVDFFAGDSFFIPASSGKVCIKGTSCEALLSRVPDEIAD